MDWFLIIVLLAAHCEFAGQDAHHLWLWHLCQCLEPSLDTTSQVYVGPDVLRGQIDEIDTRLICGVQG